MQNYSALVGICVHLTSLQRRFTSVKNNEKTNHRNWRAMFLLGMTNGGKSTLSKSIQEHVPNSCILAQDTFFKDESVIAVDSNGFKQYDVLDALHMDRMMSNIHAWLKDPKSFLTSHGWKTPITQIPETPDEVYVLIIEGFLIFNYRALNEIMDTRYFLTIPYELCKKRRCARVYTPPDPPGYFDGHVWPMYLKHRKEMEETVSDLVYLDGMKSREELFGIVYEEVMLEIQRLLGNICPSDQSQAKKSGPV